MLIKTTAVFYIDGKEILAKPGSYILYTLGTEQHYRANDSAYIDDWFHVLMCEEDVALLDWLGIPRNTVVQLPDANDISSIIRSMAYEYNSGGMYRRRIVHAMLEMMFLKISRQLKLGESEYSPANRSRYDELLLVRNRIYDYPQKKWTVDMIADFVTLSRSTVQHEYKKAFGVSVKRDIIDARVSRAKHYLISTELTLAEIAELCGYSSTTFFIRQFRAVVNKSPTEFRSRI